MQKPSSVPEEGEDTMSNEISVMLKIEKLLRPLPLSARVRLVEYFRDVIAEQCRGELHDGHGEPKAD